MPIPVDPAAPAPVSGLLTGRLRFPSTDDRLVYESHGPNLPFLSQAGKTVVIYSNEAGSTLADIVNLDGAPITGSLLTIDNNSQIPQFYGPVGVEVLYARANSGAATPIYAWLQGRYNDYDAQFTSLIAADVALDGRVDTLEAYDLVLDGRLDAAESEIDGIVTGTGFIPKLEQKTVSSQPVSNNTNDREVILDAPADFSSGFGAHYLKILGASTLRNPVSGYEYSYETAGHFLIYDTTTSGHNESTYEPVGRTAATAYRTMVYHGGQGDVVAYNAYVELYGAAKVGATHWLANKAGVLFNGDNGVSAGGADHFYLNSVEINHSDSGFDTAAIGVVLNFNRTNATASQGEVWMGVRLQSSGTQPIDVGYSLSGPAKRGVDLSQAVFSADKAAVTVKADDRIYFNSTTAALNGVNWYATTAGTAWMDFKSSDSMVEIVNASVRVLGLSTSGTAVSNLVIESRPTGQGVWVYPQSTDVDCGIVYQSKGGAGHTFRTNGFGPVQMFINHVPSATNFVTVSGSNGAAPGIGTNANDLNLSPVTNNILNNGTRILAARKTGWATATGTATRTAFDTATVTTAQLAERVKALIDDLHATAGHGLIGA